MSQIAVGYWSGTGHTQAMAEAVANLPIPLHPGAARFYREEGILPAK